jgi:PAS domain S-box-containing protein
MANGGTLFLDEVGDIPLELQPKLLRALQEQEFERLGGTRTIPINVRLLAATNRNLSEMMGDQLFRSDLYYRLNVFPIQVPPLRDRTGKITDFTISETNIAAADYYDLERGEIIGNRLLRLLPKENANALLAMARDAHESGEPLVVNNFAFALEIYGNERRFDIRAVRLDDHLMWTWRDVTERHLAAKRLAASTERYRLLVQNSSDVIARIRDGTIVWISPSVLPTFGWTLEECIGHKVNELVECENPAHCAENIARLNAGETVLGRTRIRQGLRGGAEVQQQPILEARVADDEVHSQRPAVGPPMTGIARERPGLG